MAALDPKLALERRQTKKAFPIFFSKRDNISWVSKAGHEINRRPYAKNTCTVHRTVLITFRKKSITVRIHKAPSYLLPKLNCLFFLSPVHKSTLSLSCPATPLVIFLSSRPFISQRSRPRKILLRGEQRERRREIVETFKVLTFLSARMKKLAW